ncbi:MAG: hypothetical protein LUE16_08695 [Lachnospiraceae bacterium]|nr:hypothetical protein [Lachnospiraceae bacterium]
MRRILKLNGEGVLNFIDLKKSFSIWEIYRERDAFIEFAKVHCIPLPTPCRKMGEEEPTERMDETEWETQDEKLFLEYLTKQFWLDLLTRTKEWPECNGAEETLKTIIQTEMFLETADIRWDVSGKDTARTDTRETDADLIRAEHMSMRLDDKIAHIKESGGFSDAPEDAKTVLELLAICEISEVDALQISFGRPGQKEEDQEEIRLLSGNEGTLYLQTRKKPYRFWYYTSDTLADGEKISTMRIEARSGGNRYEDVKIEFYSDADGSLIHRTCLSVKEYRYCNVTAGRMIKFLPAVSISDDLALIRENYAKSEISVLSPDADKWTLNEDFSCFAADTGKRGFLGVTNGKVNTSYYQALKDYMAKLRFDMIMIPVVEVRIGENGYELLTEEGSVITEKEPKAAKNHRISLDPYSRFPAPGAVDYSRIKEAAVSISGKSEIKHCGSAQRADIQFGR